MTRPVLQKALEPVSIQRVEPAAAEDFASAIGDTGGSVSLVNGSTTPLGGDATFTGTAVDVTTEATIIVSVAADVASATDGLKIQFSPDGTTWYTSDEYTYNNGGSLKTISVQTVLPYFRVQYVNGATPQGSFLLLVMLKKNAGVTSSHRIEDNESGQNDAALGKTVLIAKKQGTADTYQNIGATPEGDLKVSVVAPIGVVPVAQLTTLHDGKTLNRDYTEIWENVGTGTGAFANNTYGMSVTAGQYQIRQTRRFMPYFSGKPQKIELTFDNFAPQDGVVKRVGYFSSSTTSPYSATLDGVWLESSGGSISLVAQNAGVETINEDITEWVNYAVLGSYQTLSNWNNFTVVEINFLWLGGAYIELRLMTSAGWVTAHQYVYAGRQAGVFIKTPNQPVRYEIVSSTGAGSLTSICSQVATSGSIAESAMSKGVNTGHVAFTLSTVGTTYPVIAIRKGAGYRDNPVFIQSFGLFIASADQGVWTLQINPTISGAGLVFAAVSGSAVEKANGDGTLEVSSPGIIIANDDLTQGQTIPTSILQKNFLAYLSGSITGTQDQYVLCFTPSTTNVNIRGAINYFEG